MVQEPLGVEGSYWLPAGRVDPGEKLTDGGVSETRVIAMCTPATSKVSLTPPSVNFSPGSTRPAGNQ